MFDANRDATVQQFLLDIIAQPDDDFLRLVLADYLEDHAQSIDDLMLMRCIRQQMEYPRWNPAVDAEFAEWAARIAEWLTPAFGRKVLLTERDKPEQHNGNERLPEVRFWKGLPGVVMCSKGAWLEIGAALVVMTPVASVYLHELYPAVLEADIGSGPGQQSLHHPAFFVKVPESRPRGYVPHELPAPFHERLRPLLKEGEEGRLFFGTTQEAIADANRAALEWARNAPNSKRLLALQTVNSRIQTALAEQTRAKINRG